MKEIVSQARRAGLALVGVVLVFGFVSGVGASSPGPSVPELPRRATPGLATSAPQEPIWQLAYQKRGRMSIPQRSVAIDSSPMIDMLNKALKALNATDREYDGHREKAINHVEAAIHKLQIPTANAKGKGNAAAARADSEKTSAKAETAEAPAKTATTPQDESDAAMRKAKAALFEAHHKLTDKASTAGRIHADADVRIAIDEVTLALKPSAPAATPASTPAAAPASTPAAARATAPASPRAPVPAPAAARPSVPAPKPAGK